MHYSSQRIALLGLALGPALMILWMAFGDASTEMIRNSAPFAVISSVLAAVSVWIYGTFPHQGNLFASAEPNRPARLLRASALRALPVDIPDHKTMQSALSRALYPPAVPPRGLPLAREPERPEIVLKQALDQVMQSWGAIDPRRLTREQTVELYLLHQLMVAEPAEAGRLSAAFLKQDQVLLIHEQITALRRQRAQFDLELVVFEASMGLWNRQIESRKRTIDLLGNLEALGVADPDLWHHVVIGHNAANAEQRAAATWIALQPQCHKATVAAYVSRMVLDGFAETAGKGTRSGTDATFLRNLRRVIDQWNNGVYQDDDIGLEPEDILCGTQEDFAQALGRVASKQDDEAWPLPADMFRPYPGRSPAPRPAWSLALGRMVEQPKIGDYVTHLRLRAI